MKITAPEDPPPISESTHGSKPPELIQREGKTEMDGDKVGKYCKQWASASCAATAFQLFFLKKRPNFLK